MTCATGSSGSASIPCRGGCAEAKLRDVMARAQQRSAVFDMISNGVPLVLDVTPTTTERAQPGTNGVTG